MDSNQKIQFKNAFNLIRQCKTFIVMWKIYPDSETQYELKVVAGEGNANNKYNNM